MASTPLWERTLTYLGLRGDPPLASNGWRALTGLVGILMAAGLVGVLAEAKWVKAAILAIVLVAIAFRLVTDQRHRIRND